MKKELDDYVAKIVKAQEAFKSNSVSQAEIGQNLAALSEQAKTFG